jgi:Flp pilus assembly protein TadG
MLKMPLRGSANQNGFARNQRSAAAVEFALVAPLIILLFFAVYDISDAMITYEEVFNSARVISSSVSNASVQGDNGSTKLYYGQIQLQASAIFAQMPTVRSGFHSGVLSVTVSAVNFEQVVTNPVCTPGVNCNYLPYVVWSVAYIGPSAALVFHTPLRNCAGVLAGQPPSLDPNSALVQTTPAGGQAGDLTSLRTLSITTPDQYPAPPDPIIVVDVHYQYSPLFTGFVKAPLDFWADGYWPLRSVQATQLNPVTGVFTKLQANQQYTGLVSTGGPPYTIQAADVFPPGSALATVAVAPNAATYCISPYYAEPQT